MNNTGRELWNKACEIIPGGNQLLSKKVERFLPGYWPAYYQAAKGCEVWDMDGNHYYDFAQMGVGSCVLGYADDDVNRAVKASIDNGSMCTLNSYEEVALAEKLIELHPWSEMARFARSGGEACAIAIRIARAATGKSKIAFCGYHGWSDWYLAANISDSTNLDDQLLPGLDPSGVPGELRGTALPFAYNKIEALEEIARTQGEDIGVIIMEPQRDAAPENGFLERVREIADQLGAVLIFDEITSGFRMNIGGIHLKLSVEPDIAVFGKALGNGFPISAIIGKKDIMEYAESSFISSTFWTERVGFSAALATLEKMRKIDLPDILMRYGNMVNAGWHRAAEAARLDIRITGIPPLTHLTFCNEWPLESQTLYTQEMLKKGYLVGSAIYTTLAYSEELIDRFIQDTGVVFKTICNAIATNDIAQQLDGVVINPGFKRLT